VNNIVNLEEIVDRMIAGVFAAQLPLYPRTVAESVAAVLSREPGPEYNAILRMAERIIQNKLELPRGTN
jgi:hypothetical protein